MTTRKELGEMLITGKTIQHLLAGDCWTDLLHDDFYLNDGEYRLKPTTTYYRVYLDEYGELEARDSKRSFEDWATWRGNYTHIHDFQIEE